MLILTRKVDEKVRIGSDITLTIIELRGGMVRIGIEAPKNVRVYREEVFNAIKSENAQALAASQNALAQLGSFLHK